MYPHVHRRAAGAARRAAGLLRPADDPGAARRAERGRARGPGLQGDGPPARRGRHGSASPGRRSTAARAATCSTSTSSSTRASGPTSRSRSSRSTRSARRSCSSAPRSRRRSSCRKILKGELHFSIGYSEPGAGTDLASLKTTAVRDGDHYVINGQKMWTSLIHHADYVWLACRTDPDAKRHKGLSMIIVPTDAEGFSWTPVHTIGGGYTSATYYDDVRVPVENVVLGENRGWELITSQLNHERVSLSQRRRRPAQDQRRPRLGAGDQARRRPPGHRPGVGADHARPAARPRPSSSSCSTGRSPGASARASLNPADASAVKVLRQRVLHRGLPRR